MNDLFLREEECDRETVNRCISPSFVEESSFLIKEFEVLCSPLRLSGILVKELNEEEGPTSV